MLAVARDRRFRRADDVAFAATDGRAVLFDPRRNQYVGLDDVGLRVWQMLEAGKTVRELTAQLVLEYEASPTEIEQGTERLLTRLRASGFVQEDNEAAAPTVLECAAALSAAKALLGVCGVARALRVVRHAVLGCAKAQASPTLAREAAHCVAVAAALYPGRARCLEQSLALFLLLRRRGLRARLFVGATPFVFAAHAWVDDGAEPIGQTREELRPYLTLLCIED